MLNGQRLASQSMFHELSDGGSSLTADNGSREAATKNRRGGSGPAGDRDGGSLQEHFGRIQSRFWEWRGVVVGVCWIER
jgi:hypothetical protein